MYAVVRLQTETREWGGTYPLSGLESALGLCFPSALKMLCFFQIVYPLRQAKWKTFVYRHMRCMQTHTLIHTHTNTHMHTCLARIIYCQEYIATIRPIMRIVEQYAICQLVERSSWGCQLNRGCPPRSSSAACLDSILATISLAFADSLALRCRALK